MKLEDLEVYKLAREISGDAWGICRGLSWQAKKVIGDQFIKAVDSVGANIAEGWGRYHFLDRNRFNYNARGSLLEALHWLELLHERGFVSDEKKADLQSKAHALHLKLNNYINSTKEQVSKKRIV